MTRPYITLPTTHINKNTPFEQPNRLPEILHLHDPALSAMIDLKYRKQVIISQDKTMPEARERMQYKSNLHICLVVNNQEQLVGLLSLEKILTAKPIKHIESQRVTRKDVLIKQVMQPIEQVLVILFDDLDIAKVGDVIKTLNANDRHDYTPKYALVLQQNNTDNNASIRGIFLASLINTKLIDKDKEVVSHQPRPANSVLDLLHV